MNYRRAHVIGIGGVGMSATAKLLADAGVTVSGSDEGVYPPVSDFLEREGISYADSYAAANIPADADVIIIGKNARLVPDTNEEVRAAYESGTPVRSFPEILAELSANKQTTVVAGSYGKSTCTALLAHCLDEAGTDPSFFIGAIPFTPQTSARIGESNIFILEGDEYPSSNNNVRSKFLHYRPHNLLLTPIAHDHVNVFPTSEDYLTPFHELISLIPPGGTIVATTEGELSDDFVPTIEHPVITYGLTDGVYQAADITWGEQTTFTITKAGVDVVRVTTTMLGVHNVQNIVGVAAYLFSRELVTPEQFATAIRSFKGIRRRLDRKSERTTIPIFEGFGSSYEKARSAIEAMKLHFPERRLIIVFEPHTFSWRNRDALHWYDTVFAGGDEIFIYEPASQGADTHKQLSQEEIVARVRAAGYAAEPIHEDDGLEKIRRKLNGDSAVLMLSSGALGGLIESLPHVAEESFPS